jgi:hypothetical protein
MLTDCRAKTGHVIVCGLDGLAMRTIEQLHVSGVAVVVVAADGQTRRQQALQRWGIPRIGGSARDQATLAAAGLAGAVAVVCLQDDDLVTLETALLILRLRPDVRLIVQLANPGVGRALSDLTGPGTVLDVAALSAPSVVETCLRRKEHNLTIEGHRFVATELTAPRAGSLRELYGNLAPIAVAPGGSVEASGPGAGAALVICPGRDHVVAGGDRVAVIGTDAELSGHRTRRVAAPDAPGERQSFLRRAAGALTRLARTFAREADRSIGVTLALLAVLSVVSVLVLRTYYRKLDGRPSTSPSRPSPRSATATSPSPTRCSGCGSTRSG